MPALIRLLSYLGTSFIHVFSAHFSNTYTKNIHVFSKCLSRVNYTHTVLGAAVVSKAKLLPSWSSQSKGWLGARHTAANITQICKFKHWWAVYIAIKYKTWNHLTGHLSKLGVREMRSKLRSRQWQNELVKGRGVCGGGTQEKGEEWVGKAVDPWRPQTKAFPAWRAHLPLPLSR